MKTPRPTREPAANIEASLNVLRGARTARDELPRGLAAQINPALKLDLEASRFSRKFGGVPFYLVPGPDITCMVGDNPAVGSCWDLPAVRAGRATATSICAPGLDKSQVATFGIANDGIERVTIVRTNVPDRTVPVVGNVYVGMTSSEPPLPARLILEGEGKRIVHSTGLPPQMIEHGCDLPPPKAAQGSLKE